MHLADRLVLSRGYRARPYAGPPDHAAMARVLGAYRHHSGDPEMPTVEQMDASYAHLHNCDPELDVIVIEHPGADGSDVIGYGRVSFSRTDRALKCIVFSVFDPHHLRREIFDATVAAQEAHMKRWVDAEAGDVSFQAYAAHPGPDQEARGEAAWLEARGYEAIEWGAALQRPHLDDIPDRKLPDGVEVRPVRPDQMRTIWEAHWEAFRGEWDFAESTPETIDAELADPLIDHTLWKVAWAGDQIVGSVKSYINHEENEARGYRRGYTEHISTHADWRNRGVAGTLLAMSLRELRDRGMTEAALGVDTNNPGGAFQLYSKLGFELRSYEAVYSRPAR